LRALETFYKAILSGGVERSDRRKPGVASPATRRAELLRALETFYKAILSGGVERSDRNKL